MALFADDEPDTRRRRGRGWVGWSLLALAFIAIAAVALVPAPYVIEKPGPVYDTLGTVTVNGSDVPLIEIPAETTYPTTGSLDMLTVSIEGNRDNQLNWLSVALAWLNPSQAVVPIDSVYPVGTSVEQSNEQSAIDMQNSQQEAIAAALKTLDYSYTSVLTVQDIQKNSPADGPLKVGDVIQSVNGTSFTDVTELRAAIGDNGVDKAASIQILRDGSPQTIDVTPALSDGDAPTPILGVIVGSKYDFPFEVTIQLENVGGPSAGQMFALGIIDKLTKGELNGGENVAGTGTITGGGVIGPIGGIRQKMYGALDAGAKYFLAPKDNCDEVTGHIPDGLTVYAVSTLDDSLEVLKTIADGTSTKSLPTCPVG